MLRYAVLAQIGRCGNVDEIELAQGAGHQTGVAQLADAQYGIAAIFDQVHRTVGHAQVQLHLREAFAVAGQQGPEAGDAPADRCVDAQRARRRTPWAE
ncbi:hypothetical protein G6F58_013651 [Rhizopus delemar]|nr:hypothetical protein G6F58_013651 [Rhizopus delemar]